MERELDLEHFRQLLDRERNHMLRQMRAMETPEEQSESIGELADYDDHPADVATDTFEREKESALRENAREILERIESALRKMGHGTYGLCDICGTSIPIGRLEALPYATLCVKCQSDVERP